MAVSLEFNRYNFFFKIVNHSWKNGSKELQILAVKVCFMTGHV